MPHIPAMLLNIVTASRCRLDRQSQSRWEDSITAKDTWPGYILYIPYNEEVTTNLRYEYKLLM
jgi:hypothetical protein